MLNYLELFIMIFVVILLVYEFIIFRKYYKKKKKSKKNKNLDDPMEIKILINFYKLDKSKVNYNRLLHVVAFVSSLDIALIVTIAGIFENGIIQIIIALVLVLPIIFFSYYLINLYYKCKLTKGGKKDE